MATSVTEVAEQLPLQAPEAVLAALRTLGRTEDLRFSPSGRRLAIACYTSARIAVLDLELDHGDAGPRVAVTAIELVDSEALREPHGIDFVDEDTLAVANRGTGIRLLALRDAGSPAPNGTGTSPLLDSPGSVVVRSLAPGRHEVLACNNWTSTVARFGLSDGRLTDGAIVARRLLDLPDGLALSDDRQWLAVSNHNTHTVLVFAYGSLNEDSEPVGILRGAAYPHGLRFAADDRALLVADAGAPYVHVFSAADGWHGARYPIAALRVLDDDTFARGHRTPAEGGPKGIDVERRAGVLAITCEHQPLAFFDLEAALTAQRPGWFDELYRQYEVGVLSAAAATKAEAEGRVEATQAVLAQVLASRAWRLTAPLRGLNATLARGARRLRG